jgi:hypothetical protein
MDQHDDQWGICRGRSLERLKAALELFDGSNYDSQEAHGYRYDRQVPDKIKR